MSLEFNTRPAGEQDRGTNLTDPTDLEQSQLKPSTPSVLEKLAQLRQFAAQKIGPTLQECAELVFPSYCMICQLWTPQLAARFGVCDACLTEMSGSLHTCLRCSAPIPSSLQAGPDCPHCKKEHWSFDRVYSLGTYQGKLRSTVILMKRPYYESLSLAMGMALADRMALLWRADLPHFDAIVPTPQHWLRRILRRTNSSDLLSESLSRSLKIPIRSHWIKRVRATKKQGMLGGEERRKNVKQAFAVRRRVAFSGKRILLVDDILTSGSTAHAIASAFKKAGAAKVEVAVLARSIGG